MRRRGEQEQPQGRMEEVSRALRAATAGDAGANAALMEMEGREGFVAMLASCLAAAVASGEAGAALPAAILLKNVVARAAAARADERMRRRLAGEGLGSPPSSPPPPSRLVRGLAARADAEEDDARLAEERLEAGPRRRAAGAAAPLPEAEAREVERMVASSLERCRDRRVVAHLAIAAARLLMMGGPRWAGFGPLAGSLLSSADAGARATGAVLVHEVVKASRAADADGTESHGEMVAALCAAAAPAVQQLWAERGAALVGSPQARAQPPPPHEVDAALDAAKTLRAVALALVAASAWPDPDEDPGSGAAARRAERRRAAGECLELILNTLQQLAPAYAAAPAARDGASGDNATAAAAAAAAGAACAVLAKGLVATVRLHPFAAVPVLGRCLPFFAEVMVRLPGPPAEDLRCGALVLQAVRFLADVASRHEYHMEAWDDDEQDGAAARAARPIVGAAFSDEAVTQMVRAILCNLFVLRPADLVRWSQSPEEYAADEAQVRGELVVRHAARRLFQTLSARRSEAVQRLLPGLTLEVLRGPVDGAERALPGTRGFADVLAKESAYLAAGVASQDVFDVLRDRGFDLAAWYGRVVPAELNTAAPHLAVLRRRLCWLLGVWADSMPVEMLGDASERVLALLGGDADMVVRLEAAGTARELASALYYAARCDEDEEEPGAAARSAAAGDLLARMLEPLVARLFALLGDACETATRVRVLEVVCELVSLAEERFAPAAALTLESLRVVWRAGDDAGSSLLRTSVVLIMHQLLATFHARSPGLVAEVVPMLRLAAAREGEDDPLEFLRPVLLRLWHAAVQYPAALHPGVAELLGPLLALAPAVFAPGDHYAPDGYLAMLGSYALHAEGPALLRAHAGAVRACVATACGAAAAGAVEDPDSVTRAVGELAHALLSALPPAEAAAALEPLWPRLLGRVLAVFRADGGGGGGGGGRGVVFESDMEVLARLASRPGGGVEAALAVVSRFCAARGGVPADAFAARIARAWCEHLGERRLRDGGSSFFYTQRLAHAAAVAAASCAFVRARAENPEMLQVLPLAARAALSVPAQRTRPGDINPAPTMTSCEAARAAARWAGEFEALLTAPEWLAAAARAAASAVASQHGEPRARAALASVDAEGRARLGV